MDLLLAGNIALATVILLTAIHVATPMEFSVFPTLLLATTLSRLVLNIATTRMILSGAAEHGVNAAGGVIRTFGQFVAGNQIEVGLVIFLILVVIQFVVITKGATRVSEVAARFALDGMPGRQAAIDADLNAGNIDPQTAVDKREQLVAEADYYAAMDGAGKFVRGDAIAGLVITAINLLGGLYIGLFVAKMGLAESAEVFCKLTIGDGLVSQLPSLLISIAAGILVTRGMRRTDLPDHFVKQLLGNSRSLLIAGGFLLLLTITGLPPLPLLVLGAGFLIIAMTLRKHDRIEQERIANQREAASTASSPSQKRVEDFLTVDPLEVAIGLGLLPLADPNRGGDLMQRIASLRNLMAAEIGIVLPKVRVRDDASLGQEQYEVRLFGDLVARGSLRVDKILAIDDGRTTGDVEGESASEDLIVRAKWIDPSLRQQALIYGYETQTATGMLADHLERVVRTHADELLSHDATKHLLDELRQVAPALVDSLVPERLSISDVQRVLQGLLREAIPIRQLGIILETVGDAARSKQNTAGQIESVRKRLARTLCSQFRDSHGTMRVINLDQQLVATISSHHECVSNPADWRGRAGESFGSTTAAAKQFSFPDMKSQDVTCDAIRQAVKKLSGEGFPPVILVAPELRQRVKQLAEFAQIETHVLSTAEITSDTQIKIHITASVSNSSMAA